MVTDAPRQAAEIWNYHAHTWQELNFPAAYRAYADALKKSVDELTQDEKRQAIMNHVIDVLKADAA